MTSTIETEDVVERLRRTETRKSYVATNRTAPIIVSDYDAPINPDGPEAADTIERLREENARYREALEPFAKIAELREGYNDKDDTIVCVNIVPVRKARAALNQQ